MRLMTLLCSLWLAGCSVLGIRDTPEPAHSVLGRVGAVEIRQYGPRVAADTQVAGGELAARSTGFRRLAGYIFGANHTQAKIAMTAPVAQAQGRGGILAMTAPVAEAPASGSAGGWTIRFFMPAGASLQTLPAPDDPSVQLTAVPPETYAVLRFNGLASAATVRRESAALLHALDGSEWTPTGAPIAWFYDPPWTLPPLRRNEVAVSLTRK